VTISLVKIILQREKEHCAIFICALGQRLWKDLGLSSSQTSTENDKHVSMIHLDMRLSRRSAC